MIDEKRLEAVITHLYALGDSYDEQCIEAAVMIEELKAELGRMTRRADAAVRDLHMVSSCKTCVTLRDSSVPTSFCLSCVKKGKCNYKWRGVTE